MSPDTVFRDPYLLDLLGLKGAYSERDLESAILREIEGVLLELGAGFTFVARQKRMSVGKDDFYLDLLFFHRHLRRLIAVELKLESFAPAHIGQMELYLRWLDKPWCMGSVTSSGARRSNTGRWWTTSCAPATAMCSTSSALWMACWTSAGTSPCCRCTGSYAGITG